MRMKFRGVAEIEAEIYEFMYNIECYETGDQLENECR